MDIAELFLADCENDFCSSSVGAGLAGRRNIRLCQGCRNLIMERAREYETDKIANYPISYELSKILDHLPLGKPREKQWPVI